MRKQSITRPQALAVQRTRGFTAQTVAVQNPNPNVLHPLGNIFPSIRVFFDSFLSKCFRILLGHS